MANKLSLKDAERIARKLFPDDVSDGSDCRNEYGRKGEPCNICADNIKRWKDRIEMVHKTINGVVWP